MWKEKNVLMDEKAISRAIRRIAHEIIEGMENVKEEGESTGQFISAAMRGEIKRRQRRKAKEQE